MKLASIIVFFLFRYAAMHLKNNDSLLNVLEKTMLQYKKYDSKKQQRIRLLQDLQSKNKNTSQEAYIINNHLIKEYIPYNFDLALKYIQHNRAIASKSTNQNEKNESTLQFSRILSTSGNYKEAVDVLERISRKTLSQTEQNDYYYNLMKVYWSLSFYSPSEEGHSKYLKFHNLYKDSLLQIADRNSERYLSIIEQQLRDRKLFDQSLKINDRRIKLAKLGTRDYSRVTFDRAQSYPDDVELKKKYLILSAISDIQGSIKDNASLSALAMILFKENQVEKAHRYINFSYNDVVFYNSPFRYAAISNILPIINKAYDLNTQRQKDKLHSYLLIISILTIILLFTVIYIYRQLKNLSLARKELQNANNQLKGLNDTLINANIELKDLYAQLSESNHLKEYYIGNFLNICSNYIDKMDTYRKMVKKMIVSKQVLELFEKQKSTQIIDDELELFYKNFDTTFLNIYPDFVTELNNLLLPEEKIILKKDELLNTELRIFALIRLGISESATIAKLLHYSVNTIYNYRVKIKNKAAVPRDDFEKIILTIGAFAK